MANTLDTVAVWFGALNEVEDVVSEVAIRAGEIDAFNRVVVIGKLFDDGHHDSALGSIEQEIQKITPGVSRKLVQTLVQSRAYMKVTMGDYAGAVVDYDLAVCAEPKAFVVVHDASPHATHSDSSSGAGGRLSELSRLSTTARKLVQNTMTSRASAKFTLGDWEGAARDYDYAILATPTAKTHAARAHVRAYLGDRKGALADVSRARELDPNIVLNRLEDAHGAQGRTVDAQGRTVDAQGRVQLMDVLQLCARTCSECSAFNHVRTHLQCGCRQERYCSRECQKAHWKEGHHKTCPAHTRRRRQGTSMDVESHLETLGYAGTSRHTPRLVFVGTP